MKTFARLLLFCAPLLHAQKPKSNDVGMDFALHSTFIKCYIHHWKGSEVAGILGSENKVKMICDGFWSKFVSASKNPAFADSIASPFELLIPGSPASDIPFSVWDMYLGDTLTMSTANPLRESK